MDRPNLYSVKMSVGECRGYFRAVHCECRCLPRTGHGSRYVTTLACREQRRAVAMCVQVPVESRVGPGNMIIGGCRVRESKWHLFADAYMG